MTMPWQNRWTVEDLSRYLPEVRSFRQLLPKLGLKYSGANADRIKKICIKQNLDFNHFQSKILPDNSVSLTTLFESTKCSSSNLRKRLLKEGIFPHKCFSCNLTDWLTEPIPLELHHIDGCRSNNKLENLTLLCPNCHAKTDTYRGRNKKVGR